MAFPFVSARYPHPSSTVSTIGFGRLLMALFYYQFPFQELHHTNSEGAFAQRFKKLCESKFAQRGKQALHLFQRVVVHKTDAQQAALGFDAETFRQVQCVEVAVPSEDAALAEK